MYENVLRVSCKRLVTRNEGSNCEIVFLLRFQLHKIPQCFVVVGTLDYAGEEIWGAGMEFDAIVEVWPAMAAA